MPVINVQETPFKPSQQLALLCQVVCGTSEMCLLRGAHDNNCDSAEDAKHLRPRFIRVHAVRTIPGWHGTNAPEDKCSCIPNFLYTWFTILTDLLPWTKVRKQYSLHFASRGNISTEWMNDMWSYSTMTSASWESSNVERAWPSMGHWTSKDAYLSSSTARMADSKCYIYSIAQAILLQSPGSAHSAVDPNWDVPSTWYNVLALSAYIL